MAISIHALREEGDQNGGECCGRVVISIHALREEGDYAIAAPKGQVQNFYPRPPRGGRQTASAGAEEAVLFLSTPSARRATRTMYRMQTTQAFLSTPSARRATPRASSS